MQVMPELTMASHFVGVPYNRSGVSVSIINPEEFQKAGIETLTEPFPRRPAFSRWTEAVPGSAVP